MSDERRNRAESDLQRSALEDAGEKTVFRAAGDGGPRDGWIAGLEKKKSRRGLVRGLLLVLLFLIDEDKVERGIPQIGRASCRERVS